MPSIEERKLKRIDINHMEALAEALKIKKVGNWYCGLETALKLNNLTHEFFTTDFIVNDTIFRAKPIKVLGHKIKFIKLKKSLFGFGIITKKLKFSDLEKTVLDMIYLSLYGGLNAREVKAKIADLWRFCSKKKMNNYVKNYSQTVEKLVKEYDQSN